MKYALLLVAMAGVFSFSCFAQRIGNGATGIEMKNVRDFEGLMPQDGLAVVAYRVQERINMNFGSSITTYEVSKLSLVNRNELGESNSRVVALKYGKARTKINAVVFAEAMPKAANALFISLFPRSKFVRIPPKYVNIDILSTYERVIDRGYKTPDMLRRVANARFFDDDLVTAEKYYTQLFAMTTDVETVIFYRYAQCLKKVGQSEKSEEMMKLFTIKDN